MTVPAYLSGQSCEASVIEIKDPPRPFHTQATQVALRCPLCGNPLSRDPWWVSPHWLCTEGHSYSNVGVLTAELRERGWLADDQEIG
jgi:hypothetical protein